MSVKLSYIIGAGVEWSGCFGTRQSGAAAVEQIAGMMMTLVVPVMGFDTTTMFFFLLLL